MTEQSINALYIRSRHRVVFFILSLIVLFLSFSYFFRNDIYHLPKYIVLPIGFLTSLSFAYRAIIFSCIFDGQRLVIFPNIILEIDGHPKENEDKIVFLSPLRINSCLKYYFVFVGSLYQLDNKNIIFANKRTLWEITPQIRPFHVATGDAK